MRDAFDVSALFCDGNHVPALLYDEKDVDGFSRDFGELFSPAIRGFIAYRRNYPDDVSSFSEWYRFLSSWIRHAHGRRLTQAHLVYAAFRSFGLDDFSGPLPRLIDPLCARAMLRNFYLRTLEYQVDLCLETLELEIPNERECPFCSSSDEGSFSPEENSQSPDGSQLYWRDRIVSALTDAGRTREDTQP